MKQLILTPSMSKRLIGKAMPLHPVIQIVLNKGTLIIIAGTTNGYVAEEILRTIGQSEGFSRTGFRRGVTIAPGSDMPKVAPTADVVIRDGSWQKGLSIFDVLNDLKNGDVILKGANAVDAQFRAAVWVADSKGGTILAAITAMIGRRVQLLVPVGLEKRVIEDVMVLAERCNAPASEGLRLMPIPGQVFTEIEALKLLTGGEACLLASGGIYGAEGSVYLGISGTQEQMRTAVDLVNTISSEPPCRV